MTDDRRERYAEAIQRACYNAYAAEISPETPEYEIAADAAMAVADEEREEERTEFADAMQQAEYQREEDKGRITRLRADLKESQTRLRVAAIQVERTRRLHMESVAALDRVRALTQTRLGTDRLVPAEDILAALEGDTDD